MSAFLCDNSHLSFLAGYAVANGLTTASARSVAELFWIANVRSLAARYGAGEFSECAKYPFEFDAAASTLGAARGRAVQTVKSVQCFMYQTCEFREWEQTRAYALACAIREHALSLTGFATLDALSAGGAYQAAAWGGPECLAASGSVAS